MLNFMLRKAKWVLALAFVCIFSFPTFSGVRHIGGYPAQAESRFVRNVWNFIKEFQSPKAIGSHTWQEVQYYYARPYMFQGSSHSNYVDDVDLAFFAGHGNKFLIETQNHAAGLPSKVVNLKNVPRYGDRDLEFLVLETCLSVQTQPRCEMDNMFGGLHQLIGYWSLSWSDNGIPNRFAKYCKNGTAVWWAWFCAVEAERVHCPWSGGTYYDSYIGRTIHYPGYASALIAQGCWYDNLGNYAADPAPGCPQYGVRQVNSGYYSLGYN